LSERALTAARILVVDDEASIVRLFVRVIRSGGYTHVCGTSDPTEVSTLLDSVAPDLVLLDLNMPGIDGFAVLADIAGRLSQDTFLPVLTVSGMTDPEAKERAFRAGANDYLVNRWIPRAAPACQLAPGNTLPEPAPARDPRPAR